MMQDSNLWKILGTFFSREKLIELREGGYTWNQIDQILLPPDLLNRGKDGKIISWAFKWAKKKRIDECFTKIVKGAYTPHQEVIVVRRFDPFK